MLKRRGFVAGLCLGAAVMGAFVQSAFAGFNDLGKRMPADTNAVVAINVADMLNSPLGQQEGWRAKWENAFEYGALTVPPGTIRVLGGARIRKDLESATWQLSMMETDGDVSLDDIAVSEGGYTDKLWNKMAVVSPGGAYFILMGPRTIAGYEPANDRSAVLRWVRDGDKGTGPTSDYIRGMVASSARDSVNIGIDLEEQYSASDIRRGMENDPFMFPDGAKVDLDAMAQLLASIRNVSVRVSVTDKIQAQAIINFGMDAGLMEFYAKPIIKDLLSRSGMSLDDIDNWKISVSGKAMKMEGPLSKEGLKEMLAMFTLPSPSHMDASSKYSTDPAVLGEASRKYFRAVDSMINDYSGRKDYSDVSTWLRRAAERIDRLPVVNVDPDLVNWGTQVSSRAREVATMLRSQQQDMRSKVLGVANSNTSYYYNSNGNYGNYYNNGGYNNGGYNNGYYNGNNGQNQAAAANLDTTRQRSQQMAQVKQESIQKAAQIMGDVATSRGEIRAKMSQKYGIPF